MTWTDRFVSWGVLLIIVVVANVTGYGLEAMFGLDRNWVESVVYISVILHFLQENLKRNPVRKKQARMSRITLGEGGFYESYEHKWRCPYPDCEFAVSANMKKILDPMVSDHKKLHEEDRAN